MDPRSEQLAESFIIDVENLPMPVLDQMYRQIGYFTQRVINRNGEWLDIWVLVNESTKEYHPVNWIPSLAFCEPDNPSKGIPIPVPLITPPIPTASTIEPPRPLIQLRSSDPSSTPPASSPTSSPAPSKALLNSSTPQYTVPEIYGPIPHQVATEQEKIDFLKRHDFDPRPKLFILHHDSKLSTLMTAVAHATLPLVRRFVQDGEDISQTSDVPGQHWNSVQYAAYYGQLDVLRYFLELNSELINCKTSDGLKNNILHLACSSRSPRKHQIVFWLLHDKERAELLMVPNSKGRTPECIAKANKDQILIHYFANHSTKATGK